MTEECPDRVAIETLSGEIRVAPVVECWTDASTSTGFVERLRVKIGPNTFEYDAGDVITV